MKNYVLMGVALLSLTVFAGLFLAGAMAVAGGNSGTGAVALLVACIPCLAVGLTATVFVGDN